MTNQSPIDEILSKYEMGFVTHGRDVERHFSEFKQAITSLIKELVAEAKPLYYASPDKSEYQDGFNTCIRLYEQNLLKALEEV